MKVLAANGTPASSIAIGGNIFGYACDESQTDILIAAAKDQGINFIDTADVYSDGLSEELIGKALVGSRDKWVLATKVGVKSDGTGSGLGSKKSIFNRVEKSLRRLRTDYIDIYQIHHFDYNTPILETLDAFEDLRNQGKIRNFGLSNCNSSQANLYTEMAQMSSLTSPITNQVHYNILKRGAEDEFLVSPGSNQPMLMVYGVLGRGVLTGKYSIDKKPQQITRADMSSSVKADLLPSVLNAVAGLDKLGQEVGITMSQLSVSYVLRNPVVLSAVVGFRDISQLKELTNISKIDLSEQFWSKVDAYLQILGDFKDASLGHQIVQGF